MIMSVQFGRWNFDNEPVAEKYLARVVSLISPYGPDGATCYRNRNVAILYHAFHTTKESHAEIQPCVLQSGSVLTWDGRLDNRNDLISQLAKRLSPDSSDLSIVAAAYGQWRTDCLAKLIGDWALSVWDPADQSLILAKDFVGTRQLYYLVEPGHVTWSTILDPLVLLAGHSFDLEEEYIAGWLASFPATHLTPYVRIQSVPPSNFVHIASGKTTIHKYWDFDPGKRIRYRTDVEYEEHFRRVFAESVRRRIRSDRPVLAELSGGMDSSSIVCMADTIIERACADLPELATVSYYDDSEPNWNERPYFTAVEARRGRVGYHINAERAFLPGFSSQYFSATPCSSGRSSDFAREFAGCLKSRDRRVLLSGIGGDEVTGGVPTPIPELQDLLMEGDLRRLAQQIQIWALRQRRPVLHLLAEALDDFLPPNLHGSGAVRAQIPWVDSRFAQRYRNALRGYSPRVRFFGPMPSFQQNAAALETLRRQLGCHVLMPEPLYESRYPYLDRDLVEFLFAIPREQLLRPLQRRSLMKRALARIIPREVLNRTRKAYVARRSMLAVSKASSDLIEKAGEMITSSLGIVNPDAFRLTIQTVTRGEPVHIVSLLRTLEIEGWLLHVKDQDLFRCLSHTRRIRAIRETSMHAA
jgi:asparagine synthase (glutamine-hydrolysing)